MGYHVVFDASQKALNPVIFIPVFLLGLTLAISIFRIRYSDGKERKMYIRSSFILCGVPLLVSLILVPSQILGRKHIREALANGNYSIAEGVVQNFVPMPKEGHKNESFTVNDVYFEYSDFRFNSGFNNAASHGGPIRANGQQVRLSYTSKRGENTILKVEVEN